MIEAMMLENRIRKYAADICLLKEAEVMTIPCMCGHPAENHARGFDRFWCFTEAENCDCSEFELSR